MADKVTIMYQRIALLLSKGIHFVDIFKYIGIRHFYLYGIGEMGRIVLDDLKESGIVLAAYDRAVESTHSLMKEGRSEITVYASKYIPDDDIPILISPSLNTSEIIKSLLDMGIKRHRLITFNTILYLGWQIFINGYTKAYSFYAKNYLIVGANFDNKGSQAMTFVAMSEIRKHVAECNIWFCPNFWDEIYDKEEYDFLLLRDGYDKNSMYFEILPILDSIIDVSGYAIASTNNFGQTDRVMTFIRNAYDIGVPYYLMPQSFGPLNYPKYKLAEIRELLSYVKIIYAREENGEKELRKLGLNNIKKSLDMVLQSREVLPKEVYRKDLKKSIGCELSGVAVVPNKNICLYYKDNEVIDYYTGIVNYLLSKGKSVHIIAHCDDNELCERIFNCVSMKKNVDLWIGIRDCFEFSKLITGVDYLVASRYHSIVHAYKKIIPCIAVGWADKYYELLDVVGQESYLIDVREGLDLSEILIMIDRIEDNLDEARVTISDGISEIGENDIFDYLN